MTGVVKGCPVNMIAEVKAIKTNKGRVLGVFTRDTDLEMRLSKDNTCDGIVESGLECREGFRTGKTRWRAVAAGYDGASVLVECMHGQLVSLAALCQNIPFVIGAGWRGTYWQPIPRILVPASPLVMRSLRRWSVMVGFGMKDAQKRKTRVSRVQPRMLTVWEKVFAGFLWEIVPSTCCAIA